MPLANDFGHPDFEDIFLVGALHHINILLGPLVENAHRLLDSQAAQPAISREDVLRDSRPTIGDLLGLIDNAMDKVSKAMAAALDAADKPIGYFAVTPGSMVPTNSPRENLYNILLKKSNFAAHVEQDGRNKALREFRPSALLEKS
jgi:hypothetical protein